MAGKALGSDCDQIVTILGILSYILVYVRIPTDNLQIPDKTGYYFVLWRLRETGLSRPESNGVPGYPVDILKNTVA
jgi:hypothetical protein